MRVSNNILYAFLGCIVLALFLHGWNMFHYPYYEGDEGIYVSQAWSLIKQGQLSPYTYWYDHPPFGWITLAGFAGIFGGNFFIFGDSSIDNMRFFMLLVHAASAGLVFFIARRLSGNTAVAVFATILFTISPAFLYYQRRVLLDNLMTLWLLGSLALLLAAQLRVRLIALSGVFFGAALITKIPTIVFLPAFLYVLMQRDIAMTFARRVVLWLFAAFCIGMIFIGYTLIKGEFFPPSVTGKDHVSFVSGIQFQLSRDSEHIFWHPESAFRGALADWMHKDVFTIVLFATGIIIGSWGMIRDVSLRIIMAFVLLYGLFLIRGGIVTNFHVLPWVPFVAIATAMAAWWITQKYIVAKDSQRYAYMIFAVLTVAYFVIIGDHAYLRADETTNYNNAIRYVKENIDPDKAIMTDVQGLVDLWDGDHINEKEFTHADWFSKVVNDGLIRDYKYENNSENIHYILSSHELLRQMKGVGDDQMAKQAFAKKQVVNAWMRGAGHVDQDAYKSDIGNWARFYRVTDEGALPSTNLWNAHRARYIQGYGQVAPESHDFTTSYDQAEMMLAATWLLDQSSTDSLWQWTRDQFRHRGSDVLLSRSWQDGSQSESENSIIADTTFAAAMLLVGYEESEEEARSLIQDIWETSIVEIDGRYHVLPYASARGGENEYYPLDPIALTPGWYRLFAGADPEHPWEDVARDASTTQERAFSEVGVESLGSYIFVHRETGELSQDGDGVDASEIDLRPMSERIMRLGNLRLYEEALFDGTPMTHEVSAEEQQVLSSNQGEVEASRLQMLDERAELVRAIHADGRMNRL